MELLKAHLFKTGQRANLVDLPYEDGKGRALHWHIAAFPIMHPDAHATTKDYLRSIFKPYITYDFHSSLCALVHSGFCNKIPQNGQLMNNGSELPTLLEAKKSEIKVLAQFMSGKSPFPGS